MRQKKKQISGKWMSQTAPYDKVTKVRSIFQANNSGAIKSYEENGFIFCGLSYNFITITFYPQSIGYLLKIL